MSSINVLATIILIPIFAVFAVIGLWLTYYGIVAIVAVAITVTMPIWGPIHKLVEWKRSRWPPKPPSWLSRNFFLVFFIALIVLGLVLKHFKP
jgi:hypothetical protein